MMTLLALLVATLMCATSPLGASAADASEWKQRIIYQLLTDRFARNDSSTAPCADLENYCGGSFTGMVAHLDYIVEMGFDAVWISPVVANFPGGYHGYAAQNLYVINPMFGGEEGLKAFVKAAHDKGVFVMVDVVANQSVRQHSATLAEPLCGQIDSGSPAFQLAARCDPEQLE